VDVLLLQCEVLWVRTLAVWLLHSDYLLGSGSVQAFVEHLALVAQIVPVRVVCRKTVSLPLSTSVRHSWVASSVVVG
jgi:hypothetical protein